MRFTQMTAALRNRFQIRCSSDLRTSIEKIEQEEKKNTIEKSLVRKMDAEAKPKFLIKITRYLNPHKFFFKLEYNLSKFEKDIEDILTIYGTSHRQHGYKGYTPCVDEIVVVFMQPWNKWIRAKCDYIAQFVSSEPKFILWSMDDGIPFISTKQWIHPLPENLLDVPAHSILVGGLNNIIPMERQFNMDELRSENIAARDWTELAVKNVNDLLTKSAEIWFKPEAKCGAYCFGSVTVKTFAGKRFNLATYLVKQNLANFSNNFERDLTQIATLAKSRWQKNNGLMDDIVENSKTYVERECRRPANVTHEVDVKFDDWSTQNERLRKSTEAECHQHFRKVLDELFTIHLEVADPFVSFDKPLHTRYQFRVAAKNHHERLQVLNRLKMRLPHHESCGSLKSTDNYRSFTKHDLLDSIDRDMENSRCDAQSVISTSTVFTNKKIFSRALQGLRMMQIDDSDDDDDAFENDMVAMMPSAKVPTKNPVVCIPSGHEDDLDAFKKVNSISNNNRFNRNRFDNKQQFNNNKRAGNK